MSASKVCLFEPDTKSKLQIKEDPLTTTLFWDGITCLDANNYTCSLFHTDGSVSVVLKRVTWDGANKLAILVLYVLQFKTNSFLR